MQRPRFLSPNNYSTPLPPIPQCPFPPQYSTSLIPSPQYTTIPSSTYNTSVSHIYSIHPLPKLQYPFTFPISLSLTSLSSIILLFNTDCLLILRPHFILFIYPFQSWPSSPSSPFGPPANLPPSSLILLPFVIFIILSFGHLLAPSFAYTIIFLSLFSSIYPSSSTITPPQDQF